MGERRPTKRTMQAEASKERIYEAAIAVIAEKGFMEASVKDIVERAGVSVGAFYHHFASKEGVLEENFRRADERFAAFSCAGDGAEAPRPNGVPCERTKAAADRVVDYFGCYGRFAQEDTGLDLARQLYTPRNKLFVRKGRAMQTTLSAILAEGIAAGEIATDLSPERACEWLFVGARGVVFHWCLLDGNFDLEAELRDWARRALKGLAPVG